MAVPPLPATKVAGEFVDENDWDDVYDCLSFAQNPPSCRVYHNTTQSCAEGTDTAMVFNSERYDTNAMHSTVSNTGRITFTTAGLYIVSFTGELPNSADYTGFGCWIRLNGSTAIGVGSKCALTSGSGSWMAVSTIYNFAAADYVELMVFQDNTANAARNMLSNGNFSPEFMATWIGKG